MATADNTVFVVRYAYLNWLKPTSQTLIPLCVIMRGIGSGGKQSEK